MTDLFAKLSLIDPFRALHDAWHTTSPEGVVATGSVGFAGFLADISWSGHLTAACLAIALVFGLVCQCVKQWQQMKIDVAEYQRKVTEARYQAQVRSYQPAAVKPEGEGPRP